MRLTLRGESRSMIKHDPATQLSRDLAPERQYLVSVESAMSDVNTLTGR